MNIRRTAATLSLLALATLAVAGEKRESRAVGEFTAIGVSAPVDVHVTLGDVPALSIEGPEALLSLIETVTENGKLKVRVRRDAARSIPWRGKVELRVTARRIDALSIAGAGEISAPALQGESLRVSIAGSGDVRLGGKVEGFIASIAGSGDIRAADLDAQRVKISISGSGDATVRARQSLSVSVAGSGDVRYYGDPSVEKSVLGSGSVRRVGPSPS